MASIEEAVAQLKAAFLTITPPSGVDLGGRVWAWPEDRASINRTTFPFIICAQVLNEPGAWRFATQNGYYHTWPAEVLICVAKFTTRDDISAENEADSLAWLLAGARVLFDSEGLAGGPLRLGTTSKQFTSQIGNMGWLSEAEFWGVYFKISVTQFHSGDGSEDCD
jgi:hypothetical protein